MVRLAWLLIPKDAVVGRDQKLWLKCYDAMMTILSILSPNVLFGIPNGASNQLQLYDILSLPEVDDLKY